MSNYACETTICDKNYTIIILRILFHLHFNLSLYAAPVEVHEGQIFFIFTCLYNMYGLLMSS